MKMAWIGRLVFLAGNLALAILAYDLLCAPLIEAFTYKMAHIHSLQIELQKYKVFQTSAASNKLDALKSSYQDEIKNLLLPGVGEGEAQADIQALSKQILLGTGTLVSSIQPLVKLKLGQIEMTGTRVVAIGTQANVAQGLVGIEAQLSPRIFVEGLHLFSNQAASSDQEATIDVQIDLYGIPNYELSDQ